MLSKHPFEIPSKKLSREEVVEALRLSIIAELDAINLYLQLARSIEDEKIRKVFEDIAREEKTHVGEFLAVLKMLDKEQVEELEKGSKEVAELMGVKSVNSSDLGDKSNNEVEMNDVFKSINRKVLENVEKTRIFRKYIPYVKKGRGVESTVVERVSEKGIERSILPLCELSVKFKVTQRSIDQFIRERGEIDSPDLLRASLELATMEDKAILEAIINSPDILKLSLSNWEEPGKSVLDIAKAVAELVKNGFSHPYVLFLDPSRYVMLLTVHERTGITDLERIKALVDHIVVTGVMQRDQVLVLSATPDVVDIVYGPDTELEYMGPEDGLHVYRVYTSLGVRIKQGKGIVLLKEG
ncbi:MAG: family 1 encapsulin nanocompartment shell protein [Desulfurococcaceae archaeon]